jgi:hypothetical protein
MAGRSQTLPSRSSHRLPSGTPDARRHARFIVNLPVRCARVTGRTPHAWRGRTANVSGGGFTIELPERLRPGTRVALEVRTGIGPIRVEAEIVWTRRVGGSTLPIRHGLCLAGRSELLDLPIGVLLGQWLEDLARSEARRPKRATARGKKAETR